MDSPLWIYLIGFSAQFFYTGRSIIQWYLTEKKGRIESPSLFWIFSIIGSTILFYYGWLRNDVSILLGEYLSYYIYIWNIRAKGLYESVPKFIPIVQALIPIALIPVVISGWSSFAADFLHNNMIPLWLILLGIAGQIVYKTRFIVQWLYCVKRGESLLPLLFWYFAMVGGLLIITYGIIRHDWVLVIGQVGIIPTIRNIMIGLRKNEG